ncbi:thermonuclease family protein [Paenibacillus odorifer]|uniref:thermonuclease family protein n=1 Tax=Paenibacillus odorifer TaxID=189426 RepID=UPI0028989DA8|nr:thermonuclease family protein [Paenibacillus odorifer]
MNKIYLVKRFLAITLLLGTTTACNLTEQITLEPVPTITADSSSGLGSTPDNTTEDNKRLIDAKVTRVVDGDTMKLTISGKKETIRLLLVDTPESVNPNIPEPQPFSLEASDFAKKMLTDKDVQIELDVSERDKYGRLLCYLYIDGKMFNEILLEQGYARVAYVFAPNTKYVDQFRAIQDKARERGIGIWSIENYAQDNGFHVQKKK